ncbi:MAG: RpiB/LacA/LacB family sugar-phosphate isomerase, partial [Spirochaetales bacterium]|nr:RpiB/LacA/LacB family sugar-phosphate isomerase [Spirochaetales bacterium]
KARIKSHLTDKGFEVEDLGVFNDESVDYPDTTANVCRRYLKGGFEFGIVLCGTGIGASIAANKIKGIRCALIHDVFTASMAKEHNNANIIAFGGRNEYQDTVESMIDGFTSPTFAGGRHARRVDKISGLEP